MRRMILALIILLTVFVSFSVIPASAETTYTIIYDANGGENAPPPQTKENGKDITVTWKMPDREDYDFVGWATNPDATEAEYQPWNSFTVDADTTLYAVWTRKVVHRSSLNGLKWTLDIDGLLIISGNGEMKNPNSDSNKAWLAEKEAIKTVIVKPGVTSIGDSAFDNCVNLTNVSIPETVSSIGDRAFVLCSMTDISIPETVESIGDAAFLACYSLKSILIPANVTSIGSYSFSQCTNLTDVMIRGNVQSIGNQAFSGCENLKSVTILGDVKDIGDSAFEYCRNLESVQIPASVESIGSWAFGECNKLLSAGPLDSDCNIKYGWTEAIPNGVFRSCYSLERVVFPESLTGIGENAFSNCFNLTNISIPESVQRIGAGSFYGCKGLTEVTIPRNVKGIDFEAFSECSALTSVTILSAEAIVESNAFGECSGLKSAGPIGSDCDFQFAWADTIPREAFYNLHGLTSVIIPNSVKSIGNDAFHGCYNLISVTIPEGVTGIGTQAFRECGNLTELFLPESITSIGEGAFSGCYNLTDITIPDGIETIKYSTFDYCSNLKSILIPSSVVTIEYGAFSYCEHLTDVYYSGTQAEWDAITIGGENTALNSAEIHCSRALVTFIADNDTENTSVSVIKGETLERPQDPVEDNYFFLGWFVDDATDSFDFENTPINGDLTLTAHWAEIFYITYNANGGESAPETQMKLGTIDVKLTELVPLRNGWQFTAWNTAADGSGTSYAPGSIYSQDLSLTLYAQWILGVKLQLPRGIKTIDALAFAEIGAYIVEIPDGCTSIGNQAFANNKELVEIHIPASVTSIAFDAFEGCKKLTIWAPEGSRAIAMAKMLQIPYVIDND